MAEFLIRLHFRRHVSKSCQWYNGVIWCTPGESQPYIVKTHLAFHTLLEEMVLFRTRNGSIPRFIYGTPKWI